MGLEWLDLVLSDRRDQSAWSRDCIKLNIFSRKSSQYANIPVLEIPSRKRQKRAAFVKRSQELSVLASLELEFAFEASHAVQFFDIRGLSSPVEDLYDLRWVGHLRLGGCNGKTWSEEPEVGYEKHSAFFTAVDR